MHLWRHTTHHSFVGLYKISHHITTVFCNTISPKIGSDIFEWFTCCFSTSFSWSSNFISCINSLIWHPTNTPSLISTSLILETYFSNKWIQHYFDPLWWENFLWIQVWCATEVNKLFQGWLIEYSLSFICPGISNSHLGHCFKM